MASIQADRREGKCAKQPRTWPSALIHIDDTGPSDVPTGKTARFDLVEIAFCFDEGGRRFIRMSMQASSLDWPETEPPKLMFIEVDAMLIETLPPCFAEPVPWYESALDVFRLGQKIERQPGVRHII